METKVTKYQVTRISTSLTTYAERRSYAYFDSLDEAVDWAKRHSTRDHILCEVFAKDVAEDASANDVKEANGALIYRKHGKVIEDFRRAEAPAEPEHEEEAAEAEPVMSEWRVQSNCIAGDMAYQVYRIRNVKETVHSGNMEHYGDIYETKAEAQAIADKLNAGEDPEAESTTEESSAAAEEAPADEPVDLGDDFDFEVEPVRYYTVLKIAENRKRTKFHFKRRVFYDDQQAIDFARVASGFRWCVSASVYLYDPATTHYPPEMFESANVQRDATNILRLLLGLKIFYASKTIQMDLRDVVHDMLARSRETA